jgi:Fic family protein
VTLFRTPTQDLEDTQVLSDVHAMRERLADILRVPRRWDGGLRRTTQARAIQGSNSIEGYLVSDDDAAAAVEDEEPLSADERTWAEIIGYRQVMTYVLRMAGDPHFVLDTSALRSMHFMLLAHDLTKSPGQYRSGPIYVRDESSGSNVYEGPDAGDVPDLVAAMAVELAEERDVDPMVRAAMAHLNLVMIHPFRDGNGRMARALQTLVLARDHVVEPTFSSIEEWLGRNTDDYYRVLALTGAGAWRPERETHLWVKFNLRAHHMQAQTLVQRVDEAERSWVALDRLMTEHRLPDRVGDPLYDALLGLRVRRPTYVSRAGIEERTATRDLGRLVSVGLLEAVGTTRGRHYVAAESLIELRSRLRSTREPLDDPYPWLPDEIARQARGQKVAPTDAVARHRGP